VKFCIGKQVFAEFQPLTRYLHSTERIVFLMRFVLQWVGAFCIISDTLV